MKDDHRFFRLVMTHIGDDDVAIVKAICNKRPRKRRIEHARWKLEKKSDTSFEVKLDFEEQNKNWEKETCRKYTGGNFFGGKKEIFEFQFTLGTHSDKRPKHLEYIIIIDEIDLVRARGHVGVVHLPGGTQS